MCIGGVGGVWGGFQLGVRGGGSQAVMGRGSPKLVMLGGGGERGVLLTIPEIFELIESE